MDVSRGSQLTTRQSLIAAAGVLIFAFSLYANTLSNGFVWDDRALIVENPRLVDHSPTAIADLFTSHFWDGSKDKGSLYRPLVMVTYHLNYGLFGSDARGYHFANTLGNAAVCVLVFLLLQLMFARWPLALASALVFASFPLHTENVAWIAGRTDIIASFWILTSLYLYVLSARRGSWWLSLPALAAFALALFSKEIALMTPLVVIVIHFAMPSVIGTKLPRRGLYPLLYVAVVLGFLALRVGVANIGFRAYQPIVDGVAAKLSLAFAVLGGYLFKILWPFAPNAEWEVAVPGGPGDVYVISGVVLTVAAVLITVRFRRNAAWLFALTVFFAYLAPVLNLLPLTEISAERFLYLPSLGFAIVVALGFERVFCAQAVTRRQRVLALAALGLLVTVYSAQVVTRNADWRDEMRLFAKTASAAEGTARAQLNLANAHLRSGQLQQAEAAFLRALEIDRDYAEAWSGLARVYRARRQFDDAATAVHNAIRLRPGEGKYYNNLGTTYAQSQQHDLAAKAFQRALELDGENSDARFNLALSSYIIEDYATAEAMFAAVRYKESRYVHAYFYLAELAVRAGDTARARQNAQLFLELYNGSDEFERRAQEILGGR